MTTPHFRTTTPPALKWLLNERAALEGALLRTQTAVGTLQKRIQVLQGSLARYEESVRASQAGIAALDVSIELLHPEIGGARLSPVNAWQGRYGARGALCTTIRQFNPEIDPEEVSASDEWWPGAAAEDAGGDGAQVLRRAVTLGYSCKSTFARI